MEFADVIRRRRMVRRFKPDPLPSDVVERILANAVRAPSAGFAQGWAFLALTDQADRDRFWPFIPNQTPHNPEMMNAPLVVIPLAHEMAYRAKYDSLDQFPAPYWYIDTAMASMLILLTAVDEGLGGYFFWIMAPAADTSEGKVPAHIAAFRSEFGIPDEYAPVGAIAIGYRPDDLAPQKPELRAGRRSLDEVVHRGQWGRHG